MGGAPVRFVRCPARDGGAAARNDAALVGGAATRRWSADIVAQRHRDRVSQATDRLRDDGAVADAVDSDLRVTPQVVLAAAELGWRFSRSGGPGGQGVNTTDSRVELFVDLRTVSGLTAWQRERAQRRLAGRVVDGVITIAASETRSQLRNREAARARLRVLLADALAPDAPPRRPTKPSRGATQRRIAGKKHRGVTKRLRGRPSE
jgi:ribosome-associated protein